MSDRPPDAKGRGAPVSPTNRFERIATEWDLEHVENDEEYLDGLAHPETVYLDDDTQSVVSTNNSPDINFTYSLNPYRGCLHGCSYWYEPPKPVAPSYFPAFFEFGGRTRELTFARSTR